MENKEDLLVGLFSIVSKDVKYAMFKDSDENILLGEYEQRVLILSYICRFLSERNLQSWRLNLIEMFIVESNRKKYDTLKKDDLLVEIATINAQIDSINKFFLEMPEDVSKLKGEWFLFNKKLNPIQEISIISWYVEHIKTIHPLIHRNFV